MLVQKTISQVLTETASKYPSYLAIVSDFKNTRITWEMLAELSVNIGINLVNKGFKKGDKIAILSGNIPEWIMIFFACSEVGIITVPINANLKEEEIEYIIRNANCKGIFFQEKFRGNILIETIRNLKSKNIESLEQYIFIGQENNEFLNFEAFKRPVDPKELRPCIQTNCKETIIILFTSGTTNVPKGVELNHYNLVNNALVLCESMELSEDEVVCLAAPLFHCFGVTASMLVATLAGSTMALLKECSTKNLIETLEKFKCSVLNGVPTMFNSVINFKALKKYDLSHLNKGIIAGAKYSPELFKEISTKLGMQYLMSSYGQTECSPACTMAVLTDSLEIRSTSVGKSIKEVAIKIIHPSSKETLGQGEIGEICVKGYNVMQGYCNTAKNPIDKEGWLHTGDLGYKDEDDYYYITGRLKDIIIRGGENISPFEIEEVIKQLDNVVECQVVGIEDEKYGEEIAAGILLKDKTRLDEQEIRQHVGSQLAKYKVPRYIVILEEICMTASGKINKKAIKDQISQKLKEPC